MSQSTEIASAYFSDNYWNGMVESKDNLPDTPIPQFPLSAKESDVAITGIVQSIKMAMSQGHKEVPITPQTGGLITGDSRVGDLYIGLVEQLFKPASTDNLPVVSEDNQLLTSPYFKQWHESQLAGRLVGYDLSQGLSEDSCYTRILRWISNVGPKEGMETMVVLPLSAIRMINNQLAFSNEAFERPAEETPLWNKVYKRTFDSGDLLLSRFKAMHRIEINSKGIPRRAGVLKGFLGRNGVIPRPVFA